MIAPSAIIFDFNGTISDDERLLARLFVQIFDEIGIEVTEQLYFEQYAGYSDPEICADVTARHGRGGDTGLVDRLLRRRTDLYLQAVRRAVAGQAGGCRVRPPGGRAGAGRDRVRGRPRRGRGRARVGRATRAVPGAGLLRGCDARQAAPGGVREGAAGAVRAPPHGLRACIGAGLRGLGGGAGGGPGRGAALHRDRGHDRSRSGRSGAECIVSDLDWSIPVLGEWEAKER